MEIQVRKPCFHEWTEKKFIANYSRLVYNKRLSKRDAEAQFFYFVELNVGKHISRIAFDEK